MKIKVTAKDDMKGIYVIKVKKGSKALPAKDICTSTAANFVFHDLELKVKRLPNLTLHEACTKANLINYLVAGSACFPTSESFWDWLAGNIEDQAAYTEIEDCLD